MYVIWYIRTIRFIFLIQECTLSQNINTNHAALYSTCIRTFIILILRRPSIINHNIKEFKRRGARPLSPENSLRKALWACCKTGYGANERSSNTYMNLIEMPALLHYWNDEYEKLRYEVNLWVSFLVLTVTSCNLLLNLVNHLTPNDHYMGRTAQLTSRCCILYIFSTNIRTEYFKHAV